MATHLRGQNLRAFLTLVFVGLRWGELASLRCGDVDFDAKRIRVSTSASYLPDDDGDWMWHEDTTKTNQSRSAGYPPQLEQVLRDQINGRDGGELLFPSERGGHWRQPAIQTEGHRMEWLERALKAARVTYLSPNELRHTCASLLVSSGANVLAASQQMGHSPTMLLSTYADLFDEDLDAVAEAMGRFFPTLSPLDSGNTEEAQGITGCQVA